MIHGIGALDPLDDVEPEPEPEPLPYLLLDLRDSEQFEQCHIIGARNFPHTRLARAQNYYTAEMHGYINMEGRILVVYDEDERLATRVGETLVQRGVDNAFVLSGGLKVLAAKFPGSLITGELPESCRPRARRSRPGQRAPAPPAPTRMVLGEALSDEDIALVRGQLEALQPAPARARSAAQARAAARRPHTPRWNF